MLQTRQSRDGGKRKSPSFLVAIGGGATNSLQPAPLRKWFSMARNALPEYAPAAACICVRPELMAQSKSGTIIAQLMRQPQPPQFHSLARDGMSKAWPELVPEFGAPEMVYVQLEEFEAEGFPYQAAVEVHQDMAKRHQWAEALSRALHLLTRSESECSLRTIFGLLLHAAGKCQAAKVRALQMIFQHCTPHLLPALPSEEAEGSLTDGRKRIQAATEEFLDEEKDRAFTTYLEEPTEMCLEAMGQDSLDVNVHGANTHLAVLASTLAVRLPREPDLEDESKGLAPFLDFEFADGSLEILQRPENFGKKFGAVAECREPSIRSGPGLWDTKSWLQRGGCAKDSARKAASSCKSAAPMRAKAKAYVEPFAQVFTARRFLPRLLSYLTSDEIDLGQDLNTELQALLNGAESDAFHGPPLGPVTPEEAASCQQFLWSASDTTRPQFQLGRAIKLFQSIGIVKSSDQMIDSESGCQCDGSAPSSLPNPERDSVKRRRIGKQGAK
ncbi:unnamed protein product [Symbiodinium sp. CCMP2592]|nr:unnamed protein product [Symbiodinium sp. CCMP2592]